MTKTTRRFIVSTCYSTAFFLFSARSMVAQEPRVLTERTCLKCRWSLSRPQRLTESVRATDFWFGQVSGFAASGHKVVAADLLRKCVWLVDAAAKKTKCIGRAGDGPGEFRSPSAVAFARDGQIAIFDFHAMRLSLFSENDKFLSSFTLPFALRGNVGLLATSSEILLSGVASSGIAMNYLVHRFTYRGKYLGSFGKRLSAPPSPAEGSIMWRDSATSDLWIAYTGNSFLLSRFSGRGALLASYTVRDLALQSIVDKGPEIRGRQTRYAPPKKVVGTTSLLALPGKRLLTQTVIDTLGTIRNDVFKLAPFAYEASWNEKNGIWLIAAGPAGHVYGLQPDHESPVVRFAYQPSKEAIR